MDSKRGSFLQPKGKAAEEVCGPSHGTHFGSVIVVPFNPSLGSLFLVDWDIDWPVGPLLQLEMQHGRHFVTCTPPPCHFWLKDPSVGSSGIHTGMPRCQSEARLLRGTLDVMRIWIAGARKNRVTRVGSPLYFPHEW